MLPVESEYEKEMALCMLQRGRKKFIFSSKCCSKWSKVCVIINILPEYAHRIGGFHMLLFLSMIETEEEKSKFIQIYEKYSHLMWYIANDILKDNHLAEDAVQEAFLALTKHLDKVKDPHSSKTRNFMATITKSKAIDMLRRKKPAYDEALDESFIHDTREDILDEYIQKEAHERLVRAIKSLPLSYRTVLEYKYLHELTEREIADILDATPKAVNVRIFRGRKKLRELLLDEERQGDEYGR